MFTPIMFNKILHLPSANKTLHLADVDVFMAYQKGGSNVLKGFMLPSTKISIDLSTINITLLQEPYREFPRLFAHVIGCDSTSHIPKFCKDSLFDWEEVISNELCFQLGNYFSTQ
jgi:hypothetical protein